MSEMRICPSCAGENPASMKFCGHCGSSLEAGAATGDTDDQTSVEARVNAALKSFVSEQVADRITEEGGRPTEERRLVTALFADLSGFTPLADKLDPEELLEVIDPVINRLTDIVGRYEGYVDKFAGDALLAFFGAPIAHEDDAERALLVALEMHKELAAMLPGLPEDAQGLTLHAGVNSGHVIARVLGTEVKMDYSVLGNSVILAQRLESAAPAGETYVGSVTHLLTRDRFEFEAVGDLTLKGKAEPVPAWRLLGPKASETRVTAATFVGRKKELETARLVLDRTVDGSGAVLTVSGEPGVGKSRLTREVHKEARQRGFMWLTGRCLSYGSAIAYWPFADVFRSLFGSGPDEAHERTLPRMQSVLAELDQAETLPYLARLLGLPAPELDHLDPETYRRRLHENVIQVLKAVSTRMPLVVAIEDLHWGDSSSIALVTDLAAICANHRIVLYLNARTESVPVLVEIASTAPEMMRHAFRLEPFNETEIEELVSSLLEGVAPRAVTSAITDRSAGNPFFAEEILRVMKDSGQIVRTEQGWKAVDLDAESLPPTVEGVLSSRIDLLPRTTAGVLQDASVIGRRVRIPILRRLEERSGNLDKEIQILIERGYLEVLEHLDELVFHHALVQEVAYSRLLRKQKKQLHREVAVIAEELYGAGDDTIDLLARHLYLGGGGPKAIDYLVRAGNRSKRLFANEEAILHFSHAAELARADKTGSRDRLDEILLQLGDLHEIRGQYEDAAALYAEVRDTSGHVRAWAGLASSLRSRGEYDQALGLLDQAFERDTWAREDAALLWHEKGWLLARQARFGEAIDAFEKGLEVVGTETSETVAQLLVQLTRAEIVTGRLNDAVMHIRHGTEILEKLGDVRGLARAMRVLGDAYNRLGQQNEASAALQRGLELAHRTGDVEEIGGCLINLGLVEMERKNFDEAVKWTRQAIDEFGRIEHSTGLSIGYGNVADFLLQSGHLEEAVENSLKALEIASSIGDLETVADVKKTLATIRYRQRNLVSAADAAQEAAALYDEMGASELASESRQLATQALNEAAEK